VDLELGDDPARDSAEEGADCAGDQERNEQGQGLQVGVEARGVVQALQERARDDRREADHAAERKVGSLDDDDSADAEGEDQSNRALRQDVLENRARKEGGFLDNDADYNHHDDDHDGVLQQQFFHVVTVHLRQLFRSGCGHTSASLVWFRYFVAMWKISAWSVLSVSTMPAL